MITKNKLLLLLALLMPATAMSTPWFAPRVELKVLGTYNSNIFDEGAAEIVDYDPWTRRAFVVNANDKTVDVLSLRNPRQPMRIDSIDVTMAADTLGAANSVAVARGILAVAVERDPKQLNGIVAFYDTWTLALLNVVEVGALPDALKFTPDGRTLLVANEGEPNDDYTVDPEGSISVIDLKRGVAKATVRTADFKSFNDSKDQLIADGVRIFGPGASVAMDLEPEFITTDKRGRKAYVALQEANALAVVNIRKAQVTKIIPLGTKDHSQLGNELDASNRDDTINIRNWPVVGMYQPDSIDSFSFWGRTFIVTANEGDSRDYDGFSEEARVDDLSLDPNVFPDAATLQQDENLGRLKTTTVTGDIDGDGLVEEIHAYGARSFSIWSTRGKLIWDSGSEFEFITAFDLEEDFNSTNDENDSFDNRSDDKGPEPEGVVVGQFFWQKYAFVGLERVGGIMVYNITNPFSPFFEDYVNNRDFSVEDVETPEVGDLGPEGLKFIPWWQSPTWRPLLIVGNEVSGTTTVYQLQFAW